MDNLIKQGNKTAANGLYQDAHGHSMTLQDFSGDDWDWGQCGWGGDRQVGAWYTKYTSESQPAIRSNDMETRPDNYTKRIWKRIS